MQDDHKAQVLLIGIVIILLILVVCSAIFLTIKKKNQDGSSIDVKFRQIYSSEMKLSNFGDNYFIGYFDDNTINCIIDRNGQDIYEGPEDIYYDGFYKMKDDNYLFYDVSNNKLITFYFDGENIQYVFNIDDVSYAKPIVYKEGTQEYLLGFFSKKEDSLYLYMLNNTGIIVLKDITLLGDYNDEGVYYSNSSKYLIVKNNANLVGAINLEGRVIIDYKYNDLYNTFDDTFIAKNKSNNYGIIDINKDKKIDFKYKAISLNEYGYLIVDKNNKVALYDKEYKKTIGFEMDYNTLLDFDLRSSVNSLKLYEVGSSYAVVNNYLEDFNKTEYSYHDLYLIKNGKITKKIKQIGFKSNGIIYSYDTDYNVSIYDIDFNVIGTFSLSNVKKVLKIEGLNDNKVLIKYLNNDDNTIYKVFNGNSLDDFGYGDLEIKTSNYYIFRKDNKLVIYDNDFKVSSEITGENFIINKDSVIADNSIYLIEDKSK